jgi:hypothetical protein
MSETLAAPRAVTLEIGQIWAPQRCGPWSCPPRYTARILDLKDGWVRYYVNQYAPDERMREDDFRAHYVVLVDESTGDLSPTEQAIADDPFTLLRETLDHAERGDYLPANLVHRIAKAVERRPQ